MPKAKIVGQPTPQRVHDAMLVIREYLKEGGWVQAIINVGGGASFRLTDIHEEYQELARFAREQAVYHKTTGLGSKH